ncbi:MAG: sensor histidine kinase [Desulfosarcinaceae bacterium]|jgi:signal transduction histidine kinase
MMIPAEKMQKSAMRLYWWPLFAMALLFFSLACLIVYGFHISERPSILHYPLLSVVQEIRAEANLVHQHIEQTVRGRIPANQTVSWEKLAQAIWHLDVMLNHPAEGHPMESFRDSGNGVEKELNRLGAYFSLYRSRIQDYLDTRPASVDETWLSSLNQTFQQLMGEVNTLETVMVQRWNSERRQFRSVIVILSTFSLTMVGLAGYLFWRSVSIQRRVQETLAASNDELEAKVKDRTLKLSRANDKLRLEIREHYNTERKLLQYQKQLRRVTSELLLTQEKERRRIATDIHDRIGQALAVAKIQLGALQAMLVDPSQIAPVGEVRQLITQTIKDTRTLTFELSPPVLYELGLQAAIEWLAENIQNQGNLTVHVTGNSNTEKLDANRRAFLFRAVRELLFNAVKHADAKHITVRIDNAPEQVEILVCDDGRGCIPFEIAPRDAKKEPGFGLFSIREQLHYYGGNLEFESDPGKGAKATIRMPLETAA